MELKRNVPLNTEITEGTEKSGHAYKDDLGRLKPLETK